MRLLLQIVIINTLLNLLFAESDKAHAGRVSSSALREKVPEVSESNILLLQVIDLIRDVQELKGLLLIQSEKIERLESNLLEEIEEIKSEQCEQDELMATIENMDSKVTKLGSKIEAMKSEVRLISQQKLTWQNDTYPMNDPKLFSEYAVDGVYYGGEDIWKLNPIAHSGTIDKNNMWIVDLGGLFKIHTVKVWLRDCCQDQSIGIMIYADLELIGAITEFKYLHNFKAKNQVFARKIYLKNSITRHITMREVQVYGSGPYHKDEL